MKKETNIMVTGGLPTGTIQTNPSELEAINEMLREK